MLLNLMTRLSLAWSKLRNNKLIVNASAYVSGSVLQKAARFLLVPLWARFLTPEDYGITGTLGAYTAVLSTLLGMGLHGAVVRNYYDYADDVERRKQYVTSVLGFQAIVAGLATALLLLFGRGPWERYTANLIPFSPYVPLAILTIYVDLLAQIPLALYRAQQKARKFVYFQYGKFFLTALCDSVLIVGLRWGAYGVQLSSLIASAIITLIALYFAYQNWFTHRVAWHYVRNALAFGLPLVPHMVGLWMLRSIDRLVLERYVLLGEIGLYNLGFSFGMAMQYLVTGINRAWSPYYYELMDHNPHPNARIIQIVSLYLVLIGGICLLAILFAGEAIRLLLPARYYGAIPYIPPIFLGYQMLGLYYFAGMPLFYFKKTQPLPLMTVIAGIITLVLNLMFVPRYGAMAAAWITAVGYALLLVLVYLLGQRWQKIDYPLLRYGCLIGILTLSTFIVPHLGVCNMGWLVIKLGIVVIYLILAYVFFLQRYADRLGIFNRSTA